MRAKEAAGMLPGNEAGRLPGAGAGTACRSWGGHRREDKRRGRSAGWEPGLPRRCTSLEGEGQLLWLASVSQVWGWGGLGEGGRGRGKALASCEALSPSESVHLLVRFFVNMRSQCPRKTGTPRGVAQANRDTCLAH